MPQPEKHCLCPLKYWGEMGKEVMRCLGLWHYWGRTLSGFSLAFCSVNHWGGGSAPQNSVQGSPNLGMSKKNNWKPLWFCDFFKRSKFLIALKKNTPHRLGSPAENSVGFPTPLVASIAEDKFLKNACSAPATVWSWRSCHRRCLFAAIYQVDNSQWVWELLL